MVVLTYWTRCTRDGTQGTRDVETGVFILDRQKVIIHGVSVDMTVAWEMLGTTK